MTFSKRQLKKAAKYSLAVGLVVPAFSAIIYLVALAPCLLYTSPSPRDVEESRMPSSA